MNSETHPQTHVDAASGSASDASQQYIQAQTGPTVPYDRDAIYTQLEAYTDGNQEFESGLDAILGPLQSSSATTEQLQQTKQRAKVFFFMSKTGTQVDFDDYTAWLSSRSTPGPVTGSSDAEERKESSATSAPTSANVPSEPAEPYPASFDAIVELIATGQTDKIEGIRDIPLKINEEEPTKASLSRPLKPWEKQADGEDAQVDPPTPTPQEEAMEEVEKEAAAST